MIKIIAVIHQNVKIIIIFVLKIFFYFLYMKSINIGNLTLKMPVIQGGMGVGISLSGLASAVANEGGVGVISSAGLGLLYKNFSADYLKASIYGLKEEIRKAREKSNGIIGVNVMVAMSNFADMVRTAIQEKADIIFSGAGLPLDMPSFLKSDSTTKLVPIVSSARAAKIICQKWKTLYNYLPDAIVVEGPKAGGHLGYKEDQINDVNFSLEKTIPEVVKVAEEYKAEKTIPVFAAGGIYTGEDMSRIMELGASGVQMGTRFVTTNECDASDAFKQAYINAEEKDIEIIKSPVGMPGRAIWNNFIQRMKDGNAHPKSCVCHCIKTCDSQKSPYCIIMALYNAFKGNLDKGYAFAGSNAFRAKSIESVKDIFNSLKTEYENYQKKKQQ